MMIYTTYCENCGAKYNFQASGGTTLNKYNDEKYCSTCKEAIIEALAEIPKVSEQKWVTTSDCGLEQLLQWEKENNDLLKEKHKDTLFPIMKAVYPGTVDLSTGESSRQDTVKCPKTGRKYFYCYYPSKISEAVIKVHVRVNMNGEIIDYVTK